MIEFKVLKHKNDIVQRKENIIMRKRIIKFFVAILTLMCILLNEYNVSFANDYKVDNSVIPEDAILVECEYISDNMVVYTYEQYEYSYMGSRSIGARTISRYRVFQVANEDVIVIKGTASFSYGHSDGIARATSVSYEVVKNETSWGCSVYGFSTSLKNGNPAIATIYYKICDYNGVETNRIFSIYCNNNGTSY